MEDSSEDEEPDPDLEIYEEAKRKHKAEQAEKENDIVFLDMTTVVPVISSRLSETYEATQAEIQRNLERLEEVKNMLHAPTPEQPDNSKTRHKLDWCQTFSPRIQAMLPMHSATILYTRMLRLQTCFYTARLVFTNRHDVGE